jgi:hypothetical protein
MTAILNLPPAQQESTKFGRFEMREKNETYISEIELTLGKHSRSVLAGT